MPHYYWDFGEDEIVVRSDNIKYPVVGRFQFSSALGLGASRALEQAEQRIADLNAGRVTPKDCYKELSDENAS